MKSGMDLDEGEGEGLFLLCFLLSSFTQQPTVKNKNRYKRESSSTKCESKEVVRWGSVLAQPPPLAV